MAKNYAPTDFPHLQLFTGYSFKYGAALPSAFVERAAELGMSSLAITDRDSAAGVIRFAKSARANGLAPMVGINFALLHKRERVTIFARAGSLPALYRFYSATIGAGQSHITYQNLDSLASLTNQLLLLHGHDSKLQELIAKRNGGAADSLLNSLHPYFASQVLAVTSHLVAGEAPLSSSFAARVYGYGLDRGIPTVLTNAVRMRHPSDGPLVDTLDAARLLVPLHKSHIERRNSEGYLKGGPAMGLIADEIARLAGERDGRRLIEATIKVAADLELSPERDIGLGGICLPEPELFGASDGDGLSAILRARSEAGLSRYTASLSSATNSVLATATARMEEELATISTLGYESYFLAVADVVAKAKAAGIRVAARGSGAGSIICYLLGISGVEPLSQSLLMERFCSPLRRELPDIDIDVESARRLEVYDQIFDHFTLDRTATVAMVDSYRARHAIRDAGAALGISMIEIGAIAKALPNVRARNIASALERLPELRGLQLQTPLMKAAITIAASLDGLPRHLAMHPCAVLLADKSLRDRVPIIQNQSGYPMATFDKDDVEDIGLLKLDVLGVRMQSAIAYAIKEVARVEGKEIDVDALALDDVATYDLIKSTRTLGIFQIESPGQRELVGKFGPRDFTDLIIDISLFRPGPVKSDMIRPFMQARHGFWPRQLLDSRLDWIVDESEGVVVFHEQVIRLIAVTTGSTLAQADEIRRALGVSGAGDEQKKLAQWFYGAALAQGFSEQIANRVWEILRAFGSFGFCKAHAAAFALPTYQSAWLKAHHPAAFFAGLLTHDPGMYPRRVILDDARQWGIKILPLDINNSKADYFVELSNHSGATAYRAPDTSSTGAPLVLPDGRGFGIRVGLKDLHGINQSEIEAIVANQPYIDLPDFMARAAISDPVLQSLILLGAFDQIYSELTLKPGEDAPNRRDLLLHANEISRSTHRISGQLSFAMAPIAPPKSGLAELSAGERVRHELDLLGMEVSEHLLNFYGDFLNQIGAVRASELIKLRSGSEVLVAGVRVALQTPPVKSGRRVIFLTLDDGSGCSDLTFFEDVQKDYAATIKNSWLILARATTRRTGARGISLQASAAWDLSESYSQWRNLQRVKAELELSTGGDG